MNNFLDKIKGPIINCSNYSYNNLRRVWNMAIDKYPFLIIYPIDDEDVSNTINYVIKNSLPFRIRSGGHSYEGYSVLNDGVVVDLSYLSQIEIEENNNIVIVSGGVRNQDLCNFLTSKQYPFLGGDCPKVGVSGYALGGGWSYSSRLYGLGCDNLVQIELINYQGKKLLANSQTNHDLFWACKGAGQNNFGIITKLIYNLPLKQEMITLVELNSDDLSIEKQINILELWQNYLETLDNKVTMSIEFKNINNKISLYGRALIYDDYDYAYKIMEPFHNVIDGEVKYQTGLFKTIMNELFMQVPLMARMKNVGLYATRNYDLHEIEKIIKLINNQNFNFNHITLTLYAMGGQIRENTGTSSFYNRDAKYIIALKTYYDDPNDKLIVDDYVYNAYLTLKPLTIGAYINNPYDLLHDYEVAYFGNNISKLKEIKGKYDPHNYFRYEQSIKLI